MTTIAGPARVTVVIPTYRRPELLRECLASVVNQTLREIEIFVSDNGNDEATAAVVASFGDPRIVYAPLAENIGPYDNSTRCLTLGTAPYVAILQDDDLLMPESIERRLERIEHGGSSVTVVNTAHSVIDASGRTLAAEVHWSAADGDWELDGRSFIRESLTTGLNFHISTALFRREALVHESFNPEALGYSDMAIWLRVASRGGRFAYIHEPLSAIREHVQSISAQDGLHERKPADETERITTQTLEQVRQIQIVRRQFLEREGHALPDRAQLWSLARNNSRKWMARIIVANAHRHGSVRQTMSQLRVATAVDRRMMFSVWAVIALLVALGGRPVWSVVEFAAARTKRYWGG